MDYWSVLGLPADADLRTLKREYARQLKVTRPDDDPVAFQRLRDAYEAALAAVDRRDKHTEKHTTEIVDSPPLPPVQTDPAPPGRDHERARELLKHLTIGNCAEHMKLARAWNCTHAFEDQLLATMGAGGESQLLEWALGNFKWLSPWQRNGLSSSDLRRLFTRLQRDAEAELLERLHAGDVEGFKLERIRLLNSTWLQPLELREWLSQMLARVVLHSPFWSVLLVDFLNAAHGWDHQDATRPAMPLWPALERRRQQQHAQQRLNDLWTSTDRHVAKAANLLFGEWTDEKRRSLSRSFVSADWAACEKITRDVQAHYPLLRKHMPGGNLFFWVALRESNADWLLYGALAAATGDAILRAYWIPGSSVAVTAMALLVCLAVVETCGWVLLRLCNRAAMKCPKAEEMFARPFASRAVKMVSPPSLFGEVLPAIAGAGAALLTGTSTLLVYLLALAALIGARWGAPKQSRRVRHLLERITRRPKLYVPALAMIGTLVFLFGGPNDLGHDLGLQPWTQRPCLTREAPHPCELPATQEQWYPTERTGEK